MLGGGGFGGAAGLGLGGGGRAGLGCDGGMVGLGGFSSFDKLRMNEYLLRGLDERPLWGLNECSLRTSRRIDFLHWGVGWWGEFTPTLALPLRGRGFCWGRGICGTGRGWVGGLGDGRGWVVMGGWLGCIGDGWVGGGGYWGVRVWWVWAVVVIWGQFQGIGRIWIWRQGSDWSW